MTIKFNSKEPFESFALFSNNQANLTDEQKVGFGLDAYQFFSDKAYMDEWVPIPKDYLERFSESDLPILLGIQALSRNERQRTLATVEKVTRCEFKGLSRQFRAVPEHATYKNQFISSAKAPDGNIPPSRWFDAEKPFESIARFCERFSVLSHEDQKSLVATIHNFFISKSLENQTVQLPENYRERFSQVDLKFLADLIPNTFPSAENKELEKHRFIAAIQKVTKLQFTSLPKEDRLYPMELRYIGSQPIPHNTSTGWLRESFIEGLPAKPICLDGISPLTALALQRIQYQPVNLDAVEAAGKVKSVVALLNHAKKWSMTRLEKEALEWLKSQPHTSIASMLVNEDVFKAMKEIGVGMLRPDVGSLTDDEIYHTLRYNMTFLNDTNFNEIVDASIGGKLNALTRYRHDFESEELSWTCDQYLADCFSRLFIPYSFSCLEDLVKVFNKILFGIATEFTDVTQYGYREKGGYGKHRTGERVKSYKRSKVTPIEKIADEVNKNKECISQARELKQLLNSPEARQFFIDTNDVERLDALVSRLTAYDLIRTSSDELDWYSYDEGNEGAISSPLQQLMAIVREHFEDKADRITRFLLAIDKELFGQLVTDHGSGLRPLINVPSSSDYRNKYLSCGHFKRLCKLLARKDVVAFLEENGALPLGTALRQFLECQIPKAEVDLTIKKLESLLTSTNPITGDQLVKIGKFLKAHKPIPKDAPKYGEGDCRDFNAISKHYTRARRHLQELSLLQEENEKEWVYVHPPYEVNIDNLVFYYSLQTFLKNEKQAIKALFERFFKSEYWGDTFKHNIADGITYSDAQILLNALVTEEACALFANSKLLSKKESFEACLRDHIAKNKPASWW